MELKTINVSDILANFYQPRTKFDKEGIKELAESILSNGLINPITITPDKKRKGKYMIVSGERRWQAHRVANLKTIQAVVKDYKSDTDFMIESLVENIQREDLSSMETAKFLLRIKKTMPGTVSNRQLGKVVGLNESSVGEYLDLVDIKTPKQVQKAVEEGKLAMRSASMISKLPEKEQEAIAKESMKRETGMGRSEVTELIKEKTPEPIQYEETINDYVDEALSNLHNFKYAVDKMKKANLPDLSKSKADKAITTAGLHLKQFIYFVNTLRQRGAKPDKMILSLIRANNGKI